MDNRELVKNVFPGNNMTGLAEFDKFVMAEKKFIKYIHCNFPLISIF